MTRFEVRPIAPNEPDPRMVTRIADAAVKAAKAYCYDHPEANFKSIATLLCGVYVEGYNDGVMTCANTINEGLQ